MVSPAERALQLGVAGMQNRVGGHDTGEAIGVTGEADLLSVLHRAVPATKGNTRRLVSLGQPIDGLEARIVDEDSSMLAPRAVGVIQVRGKPVTKG